MAPFSSALPAAVKQDLLRQVREQVGSSEYQRLVSALGEDGLLDLVLAQLAAGPAAARGKPSRPGVLERCSRALSAICEWAWPTHKSFPNHSYRELTAERAANIATGIVTVVFSLIVLVWMGPACPWWYYLGVLPLGFGIAVAANYGGYPYRDLTKLVVAHTGVAVLIVLGGAVLVAAGFVVYWVFVGVGNWFKWLGGHF